MIHYDIYYNIIMQAIISFQFCTNQNIFHPGAKLNLWMCVWLPHGFAH